MANKPKIKTDREESATWILHRMDKRTRLRIASEAKLADMRIAKYVQHVFEQYWRDHPAG